jgi:hypothetical protein
MNPTIMFIMTIIIYMGIITSMGIIANMVTTNIITNMGIIMYMGIMVGIMVVIIETVSRKTVIDFMKYIFIDMLKYVLSVIYVKRSVFEKN